MNEYKTCSRCRQEKSIEDFGRHKSMKDGIRSACKSCEIIACKIYRANNRETVRKTKRKWAAANKDKKAAMDARYSAKHKEQIAARTKQWRIDNADTLQQKKQEWYKANKLEKKLKDKQYSLANPNVNKEATRRYRANNPERAAAAGKAWRQRNKEWARAKAHKRRVKLQASQFIVTIEETKKFYTLPCFYCGDKAEHIDHVIPISRGGQHKIGNLVAACKSCNLSKGSKFFTEWQKFLLEKNKR